ncbi:unnamed protein product [Closterium sp. NIES-64]|nr:unnamed protein product [Closterium sp. NIES-64]CAI5977977.1 unnamed protein product [Closterium sp. NIES-64]
MTRAGLIPLLVLLLVAPVLGHGGGGGFGGGGRGGRGPHGPPIDASVTGNLTGRVGAWVSNCTTDIGATRGKFLLAVFKDESSGTPVYNLYFDADLDEYSGTAPDTINIVQGAACDSTATAALTLPSTGWTTQTRGGRGGSHTELRVTGTVEGADATVVEALLAGVPNATVTQNVFTKVINGAKQGFQNAFGGRRRGRELAGNSAGKLTQQFLKRQRQRLAWMGAKTKALFATFIGTTDTTTDSPYAVIFTDSTTGNSWSAALTGNFGKCGGRGGRGGNGPDGDSDGPGGAGGRGGRGGRGGGRGGGY